MNRSSWLYAIYLICPLSLGAVDSVQDLWHKAEEHDPEAAYGLGCKYYFGDQVEQNDRTAMELFEAAIRYGKAPPLPEFYISEIRVKFAKGKSKDSPLLSTLGSEMSTDDHSKVKLSNLRPEELAERLKSVTVIITGSFEAEGLIRNTTTTWTGTGVIIGKSTSSYFILSNCHVTGFWDIAESQPIFGDLKLLHYKVQVTFPDGKTTNPDCIFIDSRLKDFAVFRVDVSLGDYKVLTVHHTHPVQGQRVYAMGHPLGLDYTFTSGLISAFRNFKSDYGDNYAMIQTDTSINPGNSGGPLVDEDGNLVGINTSKRSDGENLSFAIDMNEILNAMDNSEFEQFPLAPQSIVPFIKKMKRLQ